MRKLRLNHNIYGAFFVLVIMGLTAVTYFTTSINQQTHTVQSQAAGTCGGNCDNKSLWISDCLKYNGSDKSSQCNDWFNAECSGCGGGNDNNDNNDNNDTGNNNNGGEPFDPTATANDANIQNLCGANPNDPRCCKINEWKNANQGTNLKDCSGGSGGTGGNNTAPTAVPAVTGGTGSCNNGQIPNGSWACFSRTKVVQCVNGQYKNESSCTSCTGISTSKSSICAGGTAVPGQCASPEIWCATLNKCTGRTSCPTPTAVPGQCASPEIWCATLNKCTGRTSCPTPTAVPGQCDSPEIWCATLNKCTGRTSCPTPTTATSQCASPEIWCATLNKCTGRTSCPTPTPACPSGTIRCSWSNTCMSRVECDDPNNQQPTQPKTQCEEGNGAYTTCPAANNKCMLREDCNNLSRISYSAPIVRTDQTIVIEGCGVEAFSSVHCTSFVLPAENADEVCDGTVSPMSNYPIEVTEKLVEQMCPIYQQQKKSGR